MFEMYVNESFCSIQGESSYAGTPCFFIRLSGCNLRCSYCDTKRAWEEGEKVSADKLVEQANISCMSIIEITGGEPLLQEHFSEFAEMLRDKTGKTVLVETNGSCDLTAIPDDVIGIVDVKCPSSGEGDSFDLQNISRLRYYDEVKFVISDAGDYEWAKAFIMENSLVDRCSSIHFSPVIGLLEPSALGEWILRDRLKVRLQVQLHKILDLK